MGLAVEGGGCCEGPVCDVGIWDERALERLCEGRGSAEERLRWRHVDRGDLDYSDRLVDVLIYSVLLRLLLV